MAGLGLPSAIGREQLRRIRLTSRHAQSQIIDVAREVELEAYDTPAFHDRLVQGTPTASSGPGRSSRG